MEDFQTERTYDVEELAHATTTRQQAQQPIRVLDICCGHGGVGLALHDLFTAPHNHGTYLGIDVDDNADSYPGDFYQSDIRDLTLEDLGLETKVDLVWVPRPANPIPHSHTSDTTTPATTTRPSPTWTSTTSSTASATNTSSRTCPAATISWTQ